MHPVQYVFLLLRTLLFLFSGLLRPAKAKTYAWKYFHIVYPGTAACIICSKQYGYTKGNGPLKCHLKSAHNILDPVKLARHSEKKVEDPDKVSYYFEENTH